MGLEVKRLNDESVAIHAVLRAWTAPGGMPSTPCWRPFTKGKEDVLRARTLGQGMVHAGGVSRFHHSWPSGGG